MRRIFFTLMLLFCAVMLRAQDAEFSQYHSNPLYLNPGFAGSNGCARAAAGHRLQWPGTGAPYNTFYISYDHYLHPLRGGLGLRYMNDIAGGGALASTSYGLVYAAHLKLFNEKLVLRPGVDISYLEHKLDWSKLTFGDMIDPRRGFAYTTTEAHPAILRRHALDIGTGIVFFTRYVYGGVAAHHITQPDVAFFGRSPLPIKYTVHLAGMIGEPDSLRKWCVSPHLLLIGQQDFRQLLGGITAKYDKYVFGLAYRNKDAFIIQAAFQNDLFRAGYSYDHTISELSGATGGSHELSVAFNIFYKKEKLVEPIRTIAF